MTEYLFAFCAVLSWVLAVILWFQLRDAEQRAKHYETQYRELKQKQRFGMGS